MKKLRSMGGYVLSYVVVIALLVLAVGAGVGLIASRNLRSAEAAAAQMEAKYQAAGDVERVYAALLALQKEKCSFENEDALEAKILETAETEPGETLQVTAFLGPSEDSVRVHVEGKSGDVSISAVLSCTAPLAVSGDGSHVLTGVDGYSDYAVNYGSGEEAGG